MTNEIKIEILENCKEHFIRHKPLVGICYVFWGICYKNIGANVKSTCIQDYLGDVLLKHKPADKTELQLFFPCTLENIPKRIEIIDKMIHELKQLK